MMKTRWNDQSRDTTAEADITSADELYKLVDRLAHEGRNSPSGYPGIEFTGSDGSTLVIGFDDDRAILMFADSLGNSFHAIGDTNNTKSLLFDYFGHHTDVQPDAVIPRSAALFAAERFLAGQPVEAEDLLLEPDW